MLHTLYLKITSFCYRYDGLLQLKTFLSQCPLEIFGNNVISWMQQCIKAIDGRQDNRKLTSTSYQVLSKKHFTLNCLNFSIFLSQQEVLYVKFCEICIFSWWKSVYTNVVTTTGTAISGINFISVFLSETLLQMSQQMPELKRTVSGFVVAKIIDSFQQTAPVEVFMSLIIH